MINTSEIVNYLRAGFPLIWIKTDEIERINEVKEKIKTYEKIQFKFLHYDITKDPNPASAITVLNESEANSIMIAENYHWLIDKPPIIQQIKNSMSEWSSQGKCFIVVSYKIAIPPELEKDFICMELQLPSKEEIEKTFDFVVPNEFRPKTPEEIIKIVEYSKGMTKKEIENVYSLSLIKNKEVKTETINEYKNQALSKTGFLKVIQPKRNFKTVIGYESIKEFISKTINNPSAKGVIFIGPPGCGKTSLAEAIVGETEKFGLSVDMGKLFSKFVGDTDKNIDQVISIITSIGNCFVLIDEFEKQFAGASGSGDNDGGTTKRALSKWLDFLQNRPEGIYIAATANSFKGIPPEYLRPGRWDTSPFYIDLPDEKTKKDIMSYYVNKFNYKKKINGNIDTKDFSGAEIEALIHIASMMQCDLLEAKNFVIPIAQTMGEEINSLRTWAKTRCIPASKETINQIKRKLDI